MKKYDWLVEKVDTIIQKNPDVNFFMTYSCVTFLKNEKIFEYVPLVLAENIVKLSTNKYDTRKMGNVINLVLQ